MPKSKNYPNQLEVRYALALLHRYIPLNDQVSLSPRYSDNGIPNYRLQATTGGKDWMVDIYAGSFFCVFTPKFPPMTFTDLMQMISFLHRIVNS